MSQAPSARSKRKPTSGRAALAATVALLLVPITVLGTGSAGGAANGATLVMPWGFLNVAPGSGDPVHVYTLLAYFGDQRLALGSLPSSITVWPLALACHLLAAGSALTGRLTGREDRRVTGGLLVLAAIASGWVALGVASRAGTGSVAALPLGAICTLVVVAVWYRRDLKTAFAHR